MRDDPIDDSLDRAARQVERLHHASAYHEAGHAIVARSCPGVTVDAVYVPYLDDGHTSVVQGSVSPSILLSNGVRIALAGKMAQERAGFGDIVTKSDATDRKYIEGLAGEHGSTQEELEKQHRPWVAAALDARWKAVDALARALLVHSALTGPEVDAVVRGHDMDRDHQVPRPTDR